MQRRIIELLGVYRKHLNHLQYARLFLCLNMKGLL